MYQDDVLQVDIASESSAAPSGDATGEGAQHLVQLSIPRGSSNVAAAGPPCVVGFAYCEDMHTVVASCATHAGILEEIRENDDGLSWPHSVNSSAHGRKLPTEGRPYKWCQHLGGLDLRLLPSAAVDGSVTNTFSAGMFVRRVKHLLASKFQ